jgi:GNAT superfamily N-acetyltransferase
MTRRTGSRMVSAVPPRALAMMAFVSDLELFEHRLPAGVSRYEWQPYARDAGFTYEWWHRLWDLGHRYSLWSVVDGDVEIARIELDQEVHYDHYNGVPHLGPNVLEVDFFEVSAALRRQGLGRAALELVAERNPGRRLVAFSEEADAFWAGLGWTRYDHPDGFPSYRPFFVASEGWPAR